MKKKIRLSFKGKKFEIELKICNWFEKFLGLMFCQKEKAQALSFNFKKPIKMKIHSFFVFFSFVAIWLDDKNKIIDIKVVYPFELFIYPKKSFLKIIEIPLNKKYREITKILVGD